MFSNVLVDISVSGRTLYPQLLFNKSFIVWIFNLSFTISHRLFELFNLGSVFMISNLKFKKLKDLFLDIFGNIYSKYQEVISNLDIQESF